MTTTMEQVVTHNFNKNYSLFELKLLQESRWQKQYGKIDVNGLGRPQEVCGKEKGFQRWAKKNKGFLRESDQGIRDDVGVGC